MIIASCGHEIDLEWNNSEKSSISYEENGSIVHSVVCEKCRKEFMKEEIKSKKAWKVYCPDIVRDSIYGRQEEVRLMSAEEINSKIDKEIEGLKNEIKRLEDLKR